MNAINVAELVGVRMITSRFNVLDEKNFSSKKGRIRLNWTIGLVGEQNENELPAQLKGKCALTITGLGEDEDIKVFEYFCEYLALFHIADRDVFYGQSEEDRADYLSEKVFPIAREDALASLNRADLRQIHLPFSFYSTTELAGDD
ncbi:hypothetical protein [Vibrio alginolyticus]|uniref:hypothetical protein n=1 Tax=Vibrio alginolyticus TaxID=663 RepID=UPI0007217B63|nr:hypothetical protein [Vibrio alginolyticus]ALR91297.1 hypothetical protein AT730_02420 [Vibrio alginolyticus]MBY7707966.1 hypothetical protein [Vibrio alginolyticus]